MTLAQISSLQKKEETAKNEISQKGRKTLNEMKFSCVHKQ